MKGFARKSQLLKEKLGVSPTKTKYEDEFMNLENDFANTVHSMDLLCEKVTEILNPNPQIVVKMKLKNKAIALRGGDISSCSYPQIEEALSADLKKPACEVSSRYGDALRQLAEYFGALADIKNNLDSSLKNEFFSTIFTMKDTIVKSIQNSRKKLGNKRLDYDSIRQKKNIPPDTVSMLQKIYEEAKDELHDAYVNFNLNEESQHIQLLISYARLMADHFKQSRLVCDELYNSLTEIYEKSNSAPKVERSKYCFSDINKEPIFQEEKVFKPKREQGEWSEDESMNLSSKGSYNTESSDPNFKKQEPISYATESSTIWAKGLYDFEQTDPIELGFMEGDMIEIIKEIDDNWFEAKMNGVTGIVPQTFVELI